MRILFALILAARAWSSCPYAGQFDFNGNFADSCHSGGAYDLIEIGTVPFQTLCVEQGAGAFSDANYLSSTASLNTAFSALASWTIELNNIRWSSFVAQPVSFTYLDADTNWLQVLSTGVIKWQRLGLGLCDSGATTLSTGVCYDITINYTNAGVVTIKNGNTIIAGPCALGVPTGIVSKIIVGRFSSAGFGATAAIGRLKLHLSYYDGPIPSASTANSITLFDDDTLKLADRVPR